MQCYAKRQATSETLFAKGDPLLGKKTWRNDEIILSIRMRTHKKGIAFVGDPLFYMPTARDYAMKPLRIYLSMSKNVPKRNV